MQKFDYEIVKHIATLSKHGIVSKELTYTSFQGSDPKYDLRTWSNFGEPEERMLKGITLDEAELKALQEALASIKDRS